MSTYPPGMTLRPLTAWPTTFTTRRREAPFRSTFTATLELLDRELRQLDPKDRHYPPSILQIALRERDFRISDGMPRANSQPEHPGVILSIEPRNKPAMSFPCDTFTHWHDNLRAIAPHPRGAPQDGPLRHHEHRPAVYRGWQAIEARPAAAFDTARSALNFLGLTAGVESDHWMRAEAASIYRAARAKTHPDRGGDRAQWDRVEAAGDVLRAAGWLP